MKHIDRLNAELKAHTAASIKPGTEIVNEHLTTFTPDNFRNNIVLAKCAVECAQESETDKDAYAFIQTALKILTTERNKLDDHFLKAKT